jgi:hypothetical protein
MMGRDDEFDLDLEDIMVMEAIWLSIQVFSHLNCCIESYGNHPCLDWISFISIRLVIHRKRDETSFCLVYLRVELLLSSHMLCVLRFRSKGLGTDTEMMNHVCQLLQAAFQH